jgi:hypothetical protein
MTRTLLAITALALVLAVAAPAASACDDNSDQVVMKLTKLDLSTDQIKAIFAYQADHKAFITKAHRDRLGCRAHEDHNSVFEKAAIGVLNDDQFRKLSGRERTEVESLRYQNYLLTAEVARLKAEIAELKGAPKQEAKTGAPEKKAAGV